MVRGGFSLKGFSNMAKVYQPSIAIRAPRMTRRQRRALWRNASTVALYLGATFLACALAGAGVALTGAAITGQMEAKAATGAARYTMVTVYNTRDDWREVATLRGVDFATCDKAQRAVWASDAPSVKLAGGTIVPSIDAYCVDSTRLPSGVVAMADVQAPVPMPAPRFAR